MPSEIADALYAVPSAPLSFVHLLLVPYNVLL
jgi:hypothetical protein